MPAPRTTPRSTTRTPAGARPAAPRTTTARPRTARPTDGRPALTAREAEALRALLVARQQGATAGTAVRRPAPRTRTTTRTRTAPRRRPAAPKATPERTGAGWRTRLGVVAAGVLVLPVAASLLLPGPATPEDDAAPRTASQLALSAHTDLVRQSERYTKASNELKSRQIELAAARKAEDAAETPRACTEARGRLAFFVGCVQRTESGVQRRCVSRTLHRRRDRRHILPAEPKAVRRRRPHLMFAGLVRHIVQIAQRIGRLVVDCRRNVPRASLAGK